LEKGFERWEKFKKNRVALRREDPGVEREFSVSQ